MKRFTALVLLTSCTSPDMRTDPNDVPTRPLHTYSIVARDPDTGDLGVAVQSHWFSTGSVVTWARPGVGAVATQSFVNVSFGPRGLALLAAGKSAADTVTALVASDPGEAVRQLAIVDAAGGIGVHTGARCIASAGHESGEGWSVQANMMRSDAVVPAMATAWRASSGPLAERLLAVLDAAEAAGGDLRGRQSAALLVVSGTDPGNDWDGRLVDLRVDDHATPLTELRRLYEVHLAYEHMNDGDAAMERGDMDAALAEYAAAVALVPDNVEVRFWNAFTLATAGHLDRAAPILREVFEADESWVELLGRLPAAGLVDEATVAAMLAAAGR